MPQLPHVEELLKDYQDGKIYRRVGFHTYRYKVGLGGAMVFLGFPNEIVFWCLYILLKMSFGHLFGFQFQILEETQVVEEKNQKPLLLLYVVCQSCAMLCLCT